MPLVTTGRNARVGGPCRSPVEYTIDGIDLCFTHKMAVENRSRSLSEARGGLPAIGFHGTKEGGCRPWILKKPKTDRERKRAAAVLRRAERKRKLKRRKKTSSAASTPSRRRG